jgi:hypothetical protein
MPAKTRLGRATAEVTNRLGCFEDSRVGDPQKRKKEKQTLWPQSASELYRPRGRSLSAKLVRTIADRGFCVVSTTDPYGRILGF